MVMSHAHESFAWSGLPYDLGCLIISEWVTRDVVELSALDVAFCNHELRPHIMDWIKRCPVKLQWAFPFINWDKPHRQHCRPLFLNWICTRDLRIHTLCIDSAGLGEGNAYTHALEDLMFENPAFVSQLQEVFLNDRLREGDDESVQSLQNMFACMPSLKSLDCYCFSSPEEYFSTVASLPTLHTITQLTVCTINASASLIEFHANLINLTHLKFCSDEDIDVPALLQLCEELPHLQSLSVDCETLIDVARISSWHGRPLLPNLIRLCLDTWSVTPNQYYPLLSHLLDRCPNLQDLELVGMNELMISTKSQVFKSLARLSRLSCSSMDHKFKLLAEAKPGQHFETIEVAPAVLPDDHLLGYHFLLALKHSNVETLQCEFYQCELPSCFQLLLRECQNITSLIVTQVRLPSDQPWWKDVFILPCLTILKLECSGLDMTHFQESLKWCRNTGRIARSVVSLKLILKVDQRLSALPDLLVHVFPSIHRLHLSILLSDADFIWMVRQLKSLRHMTVVCHDQLTLRDISLEQWQQVDKRVRYIFKDSYPSCWAYIKRMVSGLGGRLKHVTINFHHAYRAEWTALFEQAEEETYLKAHKYTLTTLAVRMFG